MRSHSIFFWIAIILISPLGFLPYSHFEYAIVDLAETIYHVKELAIGRIPYRDIFSHHFLGYLIPFYLVERFIPLTPLSIKILAVLFHLTTAYILYRTVLLISSKQNAMLTALVAVTLGWLPGWQGPTFNNQSYITPLLALLLLLLVYTSERKAKGSWYMACLVSGFMLTFDQRLFLFFPLLLVPILDDRTIFNIRTVTRGVALLILPPTLCLVWLAKHGALHDFYQQTLIFPLFFRNVGLEELHHHIVSYLVLLGLKTEPLTALFFMTAFVLLIIYEKRFYLRLLISVTTVAAIVYVALGGRFFLNYLLILTPLVILCVGLLPHYANNLSTTWERVSRYFVALACVWTILLPVIRYALSGTYFLEGDESIAKTSAKYILENSSKDSGVLVWGYGPKIYLLSKRFSNFRDMGLISVAGANYGSENFSDQGIMPNMLEEFKSYLKETPPELLIYYKIKLYNPLQDLKQGPVQKNMDFHKLPHLSYLKETVETQYELVKVFEGSSERAEIYRRK